MFSKPEIKKYPLGLVRITDDPFICCYLNKSDTTCNTPPSPFSTCEGIFYSWLVRVSAWIVALVALVTNLMVLLGRARRKLPNNRKPAENIFLANLAVADILMGVYLFAIAIADAWFGADYYRYSQKWRTSPICGAIGVIGIVSSIVSMLDLTIITIDRFLCIVYPFGNIRFNRKWSKIVCAVIWLAGLAIALLPIFLKKIVSNFYGYTDVCLGLPVVRIPRGVAADYKAAGLKYKIKEYSETEERVTWLYSSILYTYFGSTCLFVVAVCYICMFISVLRSRRDSHRPSHGNDEMKLATTISVIVGTDMLCWLPIITLSVLSQSGIDIPTKVNPWLVVFVIPINSAMNPFIYSYGILKRRKKNAPSAIWQGPV
ncbi:hypothetical protein HOLleu_36483 [Holothuria leucospilota]|uniref:G-protein coupled receptors family 1 profile domain-containing protein n=1 Tax=Holothuria leucospilota TaxID=206669 RepID=A0A9Q0YNM1_HOLLE|nr:hypothetical protein HOLleu_36483 [Holothuria leucospilota]